MAYCPARGNQVGDRADVISSGLHGHVLQIEPGVFRLAGLVFPLLLSETSGKPILYKPREAVSFDHANPVKIEVAAILLCRLGMQDIRAHQSKLPLNQLTSFGIGERAVSPAKIIVELGYDLFVREISEREEIVDHAYRIADAQAVFRGQRNDGFVLGNPVGPRDHLAVLQEEISVVHQSKCWKPKTPASRRLESPAR